MSTIAALATAPVNGGVGILRLSGPAALTSVLPLVSGLPEQVEPRHAYFCRFTDRGGQVLDMGLVLYFKGPNSYTGEDVVELQAHGGVRLLQLLLSEALKDDRLRLAQPGEFTRRAFLNGRIDLAEAEAVADLISADSEASVRSAAAQVQGELSARLRCERESLVGLHADLEGVLSFPDEADGADEGAVERVAASLASLSALLAESAQGRLIRRGAKVVLFGPPNAGKSTLFNRLLGEDKALVDDEPGTTRDALEARVEWGGMSVLLMDTAGLRQAPGRLEALGMARAHSELSAADLAVFVIPPGEDSVGLLRDSIPDSVRVLEVRSKSDLTPAPSGALSVSALHGQNVDAVRKAICTALWDGGSTQAVALTSERHAHALRRAVEALERAYEGARSSTLEVVAGEVGLSLEALGEITGENVGEALLDEIFRRFCIGK